MSKCLNCKQDLKYQPTDAVLKCESCGQQYEIQPVGGVVNEYDYFAYRKQHNCPDNLEEINLVDCGDCGSQFEIEANVLIDNCPYCGGDNLDQVSQQQLQPESLLPFTVTREVANMQFRKWISSLWLAPSNFKKELRVNKLVGEYIHFWTYDCEVMTVYRGERGERSSSSDGPSSTRWTPAHGSVYNVFDDILICASKSLPNAQVEALEPWDLENLQSFSTQFTAGFEVQNYQVALKEGYKKAKAVMLEEIKCSISAQIGGSSSRIRTKRSQHNNVSFKLILLPVWVSEYRYNNKVYRFLINGRTGEVQGDRPHSFIKKALIVASVVCFWIALGYVIYFR